MPKIFLLDEMVELLLARDGEPYATFKFRVFQITGLMYFRLLQRHFPGNRKEHDLHFRRPAAVKPRNITKYPSSLTMIDHKTFL